LSKRNTLPKEINSEPFSKKNLDRIFKIDSTTSTHILSQESNWLEFKLNFNIANWEKYARTGAAFANANGGYIVFGIDDKLELVGMLNENFNNIKPHEITKNFNSSFAPALEWSMYLHEFQEKKFGLFFFSEAVGKPVIATTNRQEFKEGDIVFRYRAMTEKIRYPELQKIIEARQKQNLESWLRYIKKIAHIGIDNVAVLDFLEGTVSGSGGTLIIDENLLQKINFIREGKLHKREGAPTLRLMGDVVSTPSNLIQPTRIVEKRVSITTPDIIHAFLDQSKLNESKDFIKQICFETSGNLPIYYFMSLADFSVDGAIKFIQAQNSRKQGKTMLLKRLHKNLMCTPEPYKPNTPIEMIRNAINQKKLPKTSDNDLKDAIKAVRTLKRNEIDTHYLLPIIKEWFDAFFASTSSAIATEFRKTICYLDCVLFRPE
jgi:hypothetical protein